MKKAGILTVCGLVAAMLVSFSDTASARPQYNKAHDEVHKEAKNAEALKAAKCNKCHLARRRRTEMTTARL